jgi:hypothetical protein
MIRPLRASAGLLLLLAVGAVNAQVYRCGSSSNVYTDQPCRPRQPVDVRTNLMDAGPRVATAAVPISPAPPLVLQNLSRVVSTPPSPPSTIWERKDSDDAAKASRTTGTFPR